MLTRSRDKCGHDKMLMMALKDASGYEILEVGMNVNFFSFPSSPSLSRCFVLAIYEFSIICVFLVSRFRCFEIVLRARGKRSPIDE